jgi:glycosyltransferase involved in cell wall biosynthesis
MKTLHLVHWKKSGIYVAVASLKKAGLVYGDEHVIEVLRESSSVADKIKSVFIFLRFLFKATIGHYDNINLHSFAPHLASLFISKDRISIFFHSNYPFLHSEAKKDKIKKRIECLIAQHANVIAVSQIVKDTVDRSLSVNCKIAYNIIDNTRFLANIPTSIKTFGSAGRFDPEKRFDDLVKVFTPLNYSSSLWLAGDGAQLSTIKNYIQQQRLEHIKLPGRMIDMRHFFENLDAYICCSAYEGFGLALAEAMSAGKLIISTKVGILAEKHDFQFLEILPNLSNLTELIHTALQLDSKTINMMIKHNLNLLQQHFSDAQAYQMYKGTQLWNGR